MAMTDTAEKTRAVTRAVRDSELAREAGRVYKVAIAKRNASIRAAMAVKGVTQHGLAAACGLSRAMLNKIQTGRKTAR